jgi:hypothetical protein
MQRDEEDAKDSATEANAGARGISQRLKAKQPNVRFKASRSNRKQAAFHCISAGVL